MGGVLAKLRLVNGLTRERRAALLDARHPDPAAFLGPRGSMGGFTNKQGYHIATYYWPVPDPKGVILLVHGQGAYLVFEFCKNVGAGKPKRYAGSWVAAMNAAGYSVAGIDNQGTGRSGGLFGYVNQFNDLVSDLLQFADHLGSASAPAGFGRGLPLFAVAGSLGGCIALQASMREPSLFAGLVLLAPMLSLERVKRAGANRVLVPISRVLTRVIPTWPVVATPKNTRFPELQRDWDSDPVTYHYPSRVRIGTAYMDACDWLGPRMATVATPLLIFHSENDTMTDPDGSKALHKRAQVKDKTLRLVNNMWHILTKEDGNEGILSEALDWMGRRRWRPRVPDCLGGPER